ATICYYTQGFCHWAKRDWATALEKFERVLTILDGHPQVKADLPKRYIRTLNYIINARIELGQLNKARADIKGLRALSGTRGFSGLRIDTQSFVGGHLCELRRLDRGGDSDKAVALAARVVEGMEAIGPRLHKEHELEFHFALAVVHFGAGQYNKALFW